MKKIYLILLFIQAVAYAQTSGNVLMNSDGTARLPDNSITIGKVVGLQDAINGKQATLVSGTNIKTVNGNNILGSGDISISSAVAWGGVTGTLSNQSDLNTALGGKEPTISAGITAQYWRGDKTWQTLNSSAVGLGNVTNESKATMFTNPAFTGTTTGITATMVGLGNVTNESKATMFTNATFTGTFNVADGSIANADLANAAVANLSGTNTGDNATNTQYSGLAASKENAITIGTTAQYWRGDKSFQTLDKAAVGLPNVDNVSDANKPISTATQTALNAKQNTITILPFSNGGISGAATTSATTGTMTVSMTTSVITITPTGACTFNASGGVAGQKITFAITTSGVSSFVLTFGTNFRKVGTLATGTTSARFFSVTFICIDGTIWQEIGRTAAQT